MEQVTEEKYQVGQPASWIEPTSDEQLLSWIVETDFSKQQYDDGRDYCYFLKKVEYTDDSQNAEYNMMAYSIQQPGTLDFASVNEFVLYPSEHMVFHRISVLREGVLIDKIPDTKFKVLDNENQSVDGVINSSKKINISIKDVRLHDIIIVEDTRIVSFTEKDFLRKASFKYIWFSPDVYWGYGSYSFDLINRRSQPITYKKLYFRDDQGELLAQEQGRIEAGETFSLRFTNYLNPVDVNREVFPFIDFATDHTYPGLTKLVSPYYESALKGRPLGDYAADLVDKLEGLGDDLEGKIQFAIEYVQNNVRYIYNEEEMHGHRPQDPWVTFEFKQGDCKAKTVLLKAVLDHLGVDSEIVLVNYNADFYLRQYLPSLFNFNHVILKVSHKGEDYFIDATYRDEYGTLENRSFISFLNYLSLKPDSSLEQRGGYRYPGFSIFDEVLMDVSGDVGTLTIKTTYRYGRANSIRRYFKNTNKKAIVDNTNNFVFNCLDLVETENENDKRKIFKDASIIVLSDDKVNNVVVTEYTATINNPYYLAGGNKYLKFYDAAIVKQQLREYVQKDVSFWQSFDSEKYQITIRSDKPIEQHDDITNKQMNVDYELFKYSLKKKVSKFEAVADIEFIPLSNVEVAVADIPSLREKYSEIGRSAYGLGVSISKPSFLDSLKSLFGK